MNFFMRHAVQPSRHSCVADEKRIENANFARDKTYYVYRTYFIGLLTSRVGCT